MFLPKVFALPNIFNKLCRIKKSLKNQSNEQKKVVIRDFNNLMRVECEGIMTEQSDGTIQIIVGEAPKEKLCISKGKGKLIEALAECCGKGGIEGMEGRKMEELAPLIESCICIKHNKKGKATQLTTKSLIRELKEAKRKTTGKTKKE